MSSAEAVLPVVAPRSTIRCVPTGVPAGIVTVMRTVPLMAVFVPSSFGVLCRTADTSSVAPKPVPVIETLPPATTDEAERVTAAAPGVGAGDVVGVGVGDALVRRGTAGPDGRARLRYVSGDLSRWAPSRPLMVVAWVIGLVVYQLINPGLVTAWANFWIARQEDLGISPPPAWTSASLVSFAVAAALTLLVGRARRRP